MEDTNGATLPPPNMPLCHSDSSQIVSNSVKGLFFNEAKMAEAKGRSATTACDELPDRNTNQIRKKQKERKPSSEVRVCLSLFEVQIV